MEAGNNSSGTSIHNLFVKLLDGKTLTLKFATPIISGETLIQHLSDLTSKPSIHQFYLISQGCPVWPETLITSQNCIFPAVHFLGRLRGGKGGFGSLLRGAATKAGQKKTDNFDACRDMSGRRLRHVNAEEKLVKWMAEEEERKLEKVAEQWLKKQSKSTRKGGEKGNEERYVERYREESARCVAEVEVAVREAVGTKRKKNVKEGLNGKRFKIWLGKKKLKGSDDEDGSDDEENERSTITSNGNNSNSGKEAEGSASTVSGKLERESGLCKGGSEEEKETLAQEDEDTKIFTDASAVEGRKRAASKSAPATLVEEAADECKRISSLERGNVKCKATNSEVNTLSEDTASVCDMKPEKPLNFDDYNSAAEIEALGMERIKVELQARGLKCGGTLQERAARLFLLKTTSLEKLPKKLLAKK